MAKVDVKLNREGVRALLRSQEMKHICEEMANKALGRLGEGYEVNAYTGNNRVNASIIAVSPEAIEENLNNNIVLKALR